MMESVLGDSENNTKTDLDAKQTPKDDLEERYNKLRGFAVKLKKKVTDLTEELKLSESEKIKAISEKDDIQKKVSQISDSIKKLQTIQLEYDKLQDSMEEQKSENKKITKNLETLVLENTGLKESLYEQKDIVSRTASELESRSKEIIELKNILKKNQALMKTLEEEKRAEVVIREQREKDYEEIKSKLEAEIQLNKIAKSQLEAAKQERTSNNVLFLEVDNYEKSIDDLKSKLSEESTKCSKLELKLEEQQSKIKNLEFQLSELRDANIAKTNQLTSVEDKNEVLKTELCDLKQEILQVVQEKQSVLEAMDGIKHNSDRLLKESIIHVSEKEKMKLDIEKQMKSYAQQIEIFKCEISRLNDLLHSTNDEMEALRAEYEGYKLRAQSVLRTKQTMSKESGLYGQNINEIESELNLLRSHSNQQQEKIEKMDETIKSLTIELSLVKEERDCARDSARDLGKKLSLLTQDYSSLREQCRGQLSTIEQLEIESEKKEESLKSNYMTLMEAANDKYQREIEKLRYEIQKLTFSKNPNDKHPPTDSKFESQDNQSRNEMYLTEREDGEGSESVDSYPLGSYNSEKHRRHSLQPMPLDELLNSSEDFSKPTGQFLPAKVDRHELEACERRITYLTVLLADAERDAEKLNQMNQLLKEDIRRQQRSVERQHHADNFEYLKNIIIKFVTLKNGDERSRLIPVLNTILKLSPEETHQLNQVAGVAGRGWLPSLQIPRWNNE